MGGKKFKKAKKAHNFDITFLSIVVTGVCLPPCLIFAYFPPQDMANAFAQKHLRSIILNVSSWSTLYFVTILLLLTTIITVIVNILLLKLLMSEEDTQRNLINR